jgi:hypothetical protein
MLCFRPTCTAQASLYAHPAEQRLANEKIALERADDRQGWADEERG